MNIKNCLEELFDVEGFLHLHNIIENALIRNNEFKGIHMCISNHSYLKKAELLIFQFFK